MGAEQPRERATNGVERNVFTERMLDRVPNPPIFVDKELPTTIMLGPNNRRLMAPGMGTSETTWTVSGSLREFIPGTYGARVTRVSLIWGTPGQYWYIRNSRIGTIDTQSPPIGAGHYGGGAGGFGQTVLQGDPTRPVYVLPAGTTSWAFAGSMGVKTRVGQFIEAVPILRRPDAI